MIKQRGFVYDSSYNYIITRIFFLFQYVCVTFHKIVTSKLNPVHICCNSIEIHDEWRKIHERLTPFSLPFPYNCRVFLNVLGLMKLIPLYFTIPLLFVSIYFTLFSFAHRHVYRGRIR